MFYALAAGWAAGLAMVAYDATRKFWGEVVDAANKIGDEKPSFKEMVAKAAEKDPDAPDDDDDDDEDEDN